MTTARDSAIKERMREEVLKQRKRVFGEPEPIGVVEEEVKPLKLDPLPDGYEWLHIMTGMPIPRGKPPFKVRKFKVEDWPLHLQAYIPKVDPDYAYRDEFYNFVIPFEMGMVGALVGESGTGKDAMVKQLCALKQQPYRRITGDRRMTSDMLIGRRTMENGNILWEPGELQMVVENGMCVVIAEPWAMPPDTSFAMQSMNERGGYLSMVEHPDPAKRMLPLHPLTRVVFTTNTRGYGDDNDKFAATGVMDASFLNRLEYMQEIPHLDPYVEAKLILVTVNNDERLAMKMVRLGNLLRNGWREGTIQASWSLRNLRPWAEVYQQIGNITEAFRMTFYGKLCTDDERGLVRRLWTDVDFGESL